MTGTPRPSMAPGPGSIGGAAVLVAVLAVAVALALAVGAGRPCWPEAVAFAAAVAGLGALGGWFASRRPAGSAAGAVGGVLAATLLRILPPLAGLAWLGAGGAPLREAGAAGLLVVFYLATLAAAVILNMIEGRRSRHDPRPENTARERPAPSGV